MTVLNIPVENIAEGCSGFFVGNVRDEEENMGKKTEDGRFAQADREALIALGAYALYFLWWYATAYGLGDGDPQSYSRIMGMPSWFFYSCIVGYPLITLFLWGVMRLFFRNMPLDDDREEGDGVSSLREESGEREKAVEGGSPERCTGCKEGKAGRDA